MTVVTKQTPVTDFVFYGTAHTSDSEYTRAVELLTDHQPDVICLEVQRGLSLDRAALVNDCARAVQDYAATADVDVTLIDDQPPIPPEALITNDDLETLGLATDGGTERVASDPYEDAESLRVETNACAPEFFDLYAEYREERMLMHSLSHVFDVSNECVAFLLGTAHLPALYKSIDLLVDY